MRQCGYNTCIPLIDMQISNNIQCIQSSSSTLLFVNCQPYFSNALKIKYVTLLYLNLNCVELALFRIKNVLVSKNSLHNKPKNLFVIDRDNGFLPRILISKLTQANCFLTSWQEYRSHFFFQSDNLKHSHWKGLNLQSMQ